MSGTRAGGAPAVSDGTRSGENGPGGPHRPRLLFLCQTLPFPPDGGVHLRSYNVLRLLAAHFEVTGLFFYRRATRPTPAAVRAGLAGLGRLGRVEAFPIPQEHSRARLLWDHFRSVITRRAYVHYAYEARGFRRGLRQVLERQTFDLVHMDSLDLAGYLPMLRGLPVVCTHHNVESDLLRRRAAAESSRLRGRYLRLQASLLERYERLWCPKVALNVAVSEADRRVLESRAPGARFLVVPNGVDTSVFQPGEENGRAAVFVGGHGWFPNRDAMEYFRDAVLPLIRAERPDFSLTWVGRLPESERARFAAAGVEPTGYVEDIRPYVTGARCFVVPIRAGGGTRLKILDAWAMGKAVVSTTIGCEGLDARDGENILIRDTPEQFAAAVLAVLGDETLRRRLGCAARATAERSYDWRRIGEPMTREYLELAARGRNA